MYNNLIPVEYRIRRATRSFCDSSSFTVIRYNIYDGRERKFLLVDNKYSKLRSLQTFDWLVSIQARLRRELIKNLVATGMRGVAAHRARSTLGGRKTLTRTQLFELAKDDR